MKKLIQKPLSLIHQRAEKEVRRSTVSQWLKQKPHYRMLITSKKQKVMSQMKGQDKIPEKQLNEVEMGNVPEKQFEIKLV